MTRRRRALGLLLLALLAAGAAAAIAQGYGAKLARGYGPLRPVVVVSADLPAGKRIGPESIASALSVRRIPSRFVPPGALVSPAQALDLVPQATLPAGSYVLAAQLRVPQRHKPMAPDLDGDRHAVQISVSGADALLVSGPIPAGVKVDVVVTSEPAGAGPGRTYVAAAGVPLLGLGPGAEGPGPGGTAEATLGLTRKQALRLIEAESFARKLTLLPRG